MSSQYVDFMRRFAKTLEIEHDFSVPEEPFCLEFDGMACYIESMPGTGDVLLYAFPGILPDGREDAARKELLAGNCFFRSTAGAALAVAPGNDQVVLQKILPLFGLEMESLMDEIEKLAVVAGAWTERLREIGETVDAGKTADTGGGMTGGQGFIRA